MLKRINELQNIGCFNASRPGAIQFEKLTLVFGRNTYGKSTLSDLLASLGSNECEEIVKRKTIPDNRSDQAAKISFLTEGSTKESTASYKNGKWVQGLPTDMNLIVFNDSFFHRNVFASRKFTHDTKVNFSQFILGESSIRLAKEIAEKKVQKNSNSRNLKRIKDDFFRDILDFKSFLELVITKSEHELSKELSKTQKQLDALQEQSDNESSIRNREVLSELPQIQKISSSLQDINNILRKEIINPNSSIQDFFDAHINSNFINQSKAKKWIKEGLEFDHVEKCQFCFQKLEKQALDLIEVYKKVFDTISQEAEKQLVQQLKKSVSTFKTDFMSKIRVYVSKNDTILMSYPELNNEQEFLEEKNIFLNLKEDLYKNLAQWENEFTQQQTALENVIAKKLEAPQDKVDEFHPVSLVNIFENLVQNISDYSLSINRLNRFLINFKESLSNNSSLKKKAELIESISSQKRSIQRVKLDEKCKGYIDLSKTTEDLRREISSLQMQLENEQTEYLENYFQSLNEYFKKFGSENFQLECATSTRGNTPVHYLQVKFKGKKVSENDLHCVFSESDRRALALSMFWAYISELSDEEKKKTIIVLDDATTSFDNGRITSLHREIRRFLNDVRQIIILSHYDKDLAQYWSAHDKSHKATFFSLSRVNGESEIFRDDIERFVLEEHEREREKIFDFIQGTSNELSSGNLRIFLEKELFSRFAQQIKDLNLRNMQLGELISALKESGVISDALADEAHLWREQTNPVHHNWDKKEHEDKRRSAREFMEFVFKKLAPDRNS